MRALALPQMPSVPSIAVLTVPLFPAQGFILESDYEGDTGHPRIGNVQPGSVSADHMVKGDIVLEINSIAVTNHNQAAKIIKAASGDILIKVLAKKPREVKAAKAGFFGKSKSAGVDKQASSLGACPIARRASPCHITSPRHPSCLPCPPAPAPAPAPCPCPISFEDISPHWTDRPSQVAAADKAAAEQAAKEHAAVMAAAEKAAAVKAAAARAASAAAEKAAAEKAVVEKAAAVQAAAKAAEQKIADEAAALERTYKPMMDQFIGECRQSAKASEQGAVAAAASKAAAGAVNAVGETASNAKNAVAGIGDNAKNLGGAVVNGTKDFFQDKIVKPTDKHVVQPIKKSIDGTKAKVQDGLGAISPGRGSKADGELSAGLADAKKAAEKAEMKEASAKEAAAKAEAEKAAKAAKAEAAREAKEAADAATKMQSIRRGQQSRKAVGTEPVVAAATAAAAPARKAVKEDMASEEAKAWMRVSFDKYDTNQSGKLDHKELREALKDMDMEMDTDRARNMLIKYDKDQSGLMEFSEFVSLSINLNQFNAEEQGASSPGAKAAPTSPSKASVASPVALKGLGECQP